MINPKDHMDNFVKAVLMENDLLEAEEKEVINEEVAETKEAPEAKSSEGDLCEFLKENYGIDVDADTVEVLLQFADDFQESYGAVIKEAKDDEDEIEISLSDIGEILVESYGFEIDLEDQELLETIVNFAIDYTLTDE